MRTTRCGRAEAGPEAEPPDQREEKESWGSSPGDAGMVPFLLPLWHAADCRKSAECGDPDSSVAAAAHAEVVCQCFTERAAGGGVQAD